jgi:hypothetical protein
MLDPTWYAWIGAIVMTILATLIPYLNKLRSEPGTKFDMHYALSAVITAVVALPSSTAIWAFVLSLVQPYPSLLPYLENWWFALAMGMAAGAFLNRWINDNIIDRARKSGLVGNVGAQGGGSSG